MLTFIEGKNSMKKKAIVLITLNHVKSLPPGYVFTSGNLVHDLNCTTPTKEFDDKIFAAVSEIRRMGYLEEFGKKIEVVDYAPRYSRGKRRPANLYRISEA
jgi:hypothetical protein